MTLSFIAIDKNSEFREFSCQLTNLDIAFDVLSSIASKGDVILKAQIEDEGSCLELPTYAFDGETFSNALYQLELQWQEALKGPARTLSLTAWRQDVMQRRIDSYENRIARYTVAISQLERLRDRVESTTPMYSDRSRLINHYDRMLDNYRYNLWQAKNHKESVVEQLEQLQLTH